MTMEYENEYRLDLDFLYSKFKSYLNFLDIIKNQLVDVSVPFILTSSDLLKPGPFILWANKKFEISTQYSLDDVLGKSPRILQGDLTNRLVLEKLKKELRKNNKFCGTTVNYKKDQTPYLVQFVISPIYDFDGNLANYIGMHNILEDPYIIK